MKYLIAIVFLLCSVAGANPFWIEKSSWFQGKQFYAVGVASEGNSAQKRQDSLKNALSEASNSLGYTVESAETSRLYESHNKTYRLIVINPKPYSSTLLRIPEISLQNLKNEKRIFFYPNPF